MAPPSVDISTATTDTKTTYTVSTDSGGDVVWIGTGFSAASPEATLSGTSVFTNDPTKQRQASFEAETIESVLGAMVVLENAGEEVVNFAYLDPSNNPPPDPTDLQANISCGSHDGGIVDGKYRVEVDEAGMVDFNATAMGGVAPYTFTWQGEFQGGSTFDDQNASIFVYETTNFSVAVNDSAGAMAILPVVVVVDGNEPADIQIMLDQPGPVPAGTRITATASYEGPDPLVKYEFFVANVLVQAKNSNNVISEIVNVEGAASMTDVPFRVVVYDSNDDYVGDASAIITVESTSVERYNLVVQMFGYGGIERDEQGSEL